MDVGSFVAGVLIFWAIGIMAIVVVIVVACLVNAYLLKNL